MWLADSSVQIWLCTQPTDMRKSFDGLSGLAKQYMQRDPLSGQLFVFVNRRRSQMKVLYFAGDGFCVWSKRLERGQFRYREGDDIARSLSMSELHSLIEGIEVVSVRRRLRYRRQQSLAGGAMVRQ